MQCRQRDGKNLMVNFAGKETRLVKIKITEKMKLGLKEREYLQ